MKFQRETFYLHKSCGDVILAEVFDSGPESITLIIGEDRYELDRESAAELAEKLIFMGMDNDCDE